MNAALAKLEGLKGWNAEYFNSDLKSTAHLMRSDDSAFYSVGNHTMYVRFKDANEGVMIHEMIHVWNHLSKNSLSGTVDDEGMAYLVQFGMLAEKSLLVSLESQIRSGNCDDAKRLIPLWTSFWNNRERWDGTGWGNTRKGGIFSNFKRARQKSDFVNLKGSIGLNFSCERQAEVINALFGQKHCCVRVRCTNPAMRIDEDGFLSQGTNRDVEIEY